MATIKDIAAKCGVSTSTVSRALKNSDSISDATKELIQKAAQELNFTPRSYHSSKGFSGFENNCIAMLLNVKNQPISSLLIRSASNTLNNFGYSLAVFDTQEDPGVEIRLLDTLRHSVQGIIIMPSEDRDNYNLQFIREIGKKIPVVTIIRNNTLPGIDSVMPLVYDTYYKAVDLLISKGHKNIGVLLSKLSHKTSFNKLNAYNNALESHGIQIKSEYLAFTTFDEKNANEKTKELLKSHPEITALVTSNTGITRGTIFALSELNLSVPDDIAMIAYGNDIMFSHPAFNLTRIEEPHTEIGKQASNLIIDRLQNHNFGKTGEEIRINLDPQLIVCGSENYPKNR